MLYLVETDGDAAPRKVWVTEMLGSFIRRYYYLSSFSRGSRQGF